MARTKQRENYGNGSVSPVMVNKTDKDGNAVYGKDGKPVKVQQKDKDGKPVWRVCVSLGTEQYTDKSGKLRKRQRKVQKVYHGTLGKAREFAKSLTEDYERVDFDSARDNFSALCNKWKEDGPKCSQKQLKQYVRHLGYMAPYLDNTPLIDLKRADIESAFEAIERDKNLSSTTLNKILSVTNRVFEYALDLDYVVRNPCRGVKPRDSDKTVKRRSLSEHEAAKLRAALDKTESDLYAAFDAKEARQAKAGNAFGRTSIRDLCTLSCLLSVRLMLATGVRRGEALALTWGNVDLATGTIRICQTINESNIVKQPKTDNGIRSLFVDEHTLEHLRAWKSFQKRALHLVTVDGSALSQSDETPVFCSNNGGWIDPTNCYRWWSAYREDIGFGGWVLHELRHSQVTLLLGHGVPMDMVQTRVGHSRPSTVTLVYLHELPARDKLAAETMGRILYETEVADSSSGTVLELFKHSA